VSCWFGRPQEVVESAVSAEGKKSGGDTRRHSRHERKESERFKSFSYDELNNRDRQRNVGEQADDGSATGSRFA
jgi:hypothetical protein